MTKEYKFYKTEENRWYIDLPDYIENGGYIEELEMVAGADIMLDILSDFQSNITLIIDTIPFENSERIIKTENQECESGANYDLISQMNNRLPIWLCDVTKYVFGDFPDIIFFKVKK